MIIFVSVHADVIYELALVVYTLRERGKFVFESASCFKYIRSVCVVTTVRKV